jgi:hypothetical protein
MDDLPDSSSDIPVMAANLGHVADRLRKIEQQLEKLSDSVVGGLESRIRQLEKAEARFSVVVTILGSIGGVALGLAATALFRG